MRYNAVMGEAQPYTFEMYVTPDGAIPFEDWLLQVRDARAIARIRVRLDRLSLGNAGDAHPVGAGVWELRIDYGPGYRVYYARRGAALLLLLYGGDKRTQEGDIQQAQAYWQEYQHRRPHV